MSGLFELIGIRAGAGGDDGIWFVWLLAVLG